MKLATPKDLHQIIKKKVEKSLIFDYTTGELFVEKSNSIFARTYGARIVVNQIFKGEGQF